MKINASYPVICTDKLIQSKAFYSDYFGFETTFEAQWYVSMRSKASPDYELALLDFRHSSLPESYRKQAQGVLINVEVPNVDDVYDDLKHKDLPMILDLKSEEWGQRHFITKDPNGILIDVIQNIPPSVEFSEHYIE